ncbi:fumarate hydratase [Burkholderia pseudomallei]|nr:fumarate hydratase [Burkholderia pseudomallei]
MAAVSSASSVSSVSSVSSGPQGVANPLAAKRGGPFASRGESTVVILRSTPFGKNE